MMHSTNSPSSDLQLSCFLYYLPNSLGEPLRVCLFEKKRERQRGKEMLSLHSRISEINLCFRVRKSTVVIS